jgi:branched-chain amino acid transport system ATP-binding protein
MLKINDIHVNYGYSEALRGVSLEVKDKEIVALLGNNGAGKTTTINTVSGMTNLVSGSIEFEGKDISKMPTYDRVKKGIVQVPEGRKLFPYLSVYDNMLIGSYLPELRAKRQENLDFCFNMFPKLYERKSQLANSLSGGEQQMCAIARALMQCPKILMLDEPSLGLAPVVVDSIFETLVNINKQGMTIFLVEQNVQSSLEIANRAYIIEIGQNVISGESSELLANEELKKAYLGI